MSKMKQQLVDHEKKFQVFWKLLQRTSLLSSEYLDKSIKKICEILWKKSGSEIHLVQELSTCSTKKTSNFNTAFLGTGKSKEDDNDTQSASENSAETSVPQDKPKKARKKSKKARPTSPEIHLSLFDQNTDNADFFSMDGSEPLWMKDLLEEDTRIASAKEDKIKIDLQNLKTQFKKILQEHWYRKHEALVQKKNPLSSEPPSIAIFQFSSWHEDPIGWKFWPDTTIEQRQNNLGYGNFMLCL